MFFFTASQHRAASLGRQRALEQVQLFVQCIRALPPLYVVLPQLLELYLYVSLLLLPPAVVVLLFLSCPVRGRTGNRSRPHVLRLRIGDGFFLQLRQFLIAVIAVAGLQAATGPAPLASEAARLQSFIKLHLCT